MSARISTWSLTLVGFMIAFQAREASAQSNYAYSNLYSSGNSTISSNTTVTCSGIVTVANGATLPNVVRVTIIDKNGKKFIGTGACGPVNGSTTVGQFTVAVFLNNAASTISAQCNFEGSTDNGQTFTAGSDQTNPRIQ